MFAKTIIDSDVFMDMPLSTQALYFHLSMRADDDGFINNPKKIQRMVGASDDDLKVLILKRFIIPFENGIVVIKHWKLHNYIQKDRYKPTVYLKEKSMLSVKENGAYTECIQTVSKMDTQVSIGKESIVKESIGEESIEADETSTPSLEDIITYVSENNLNVNAQKFYEYYDKTGWQTTKGNTFDWRAKVKEWSTSERNTTPKNKSSNPFYDLLKNGETYE
jgi:hypothetical protein